MTNNPFLNALSAGAYIAAITGLFWVVGNVAPKEDNILMPMAALALLVLSVASMAMFFFYTPTVLLVEGKKKEAFELISKTILAFGVFTILVFVLVTVVKFPKQVHSTYQESIHAGMANPASVYCNNERNGTLSIVDEKGGQVGYCHLPDGRTCEEWVLFRDNVCISPEY